MKSPLRRLMCCTQKLGDDHLQWPEKRWAALSDMVEVVKVGSILMSYSFPRASGTADKLDGVADCVMAHLPNCAVQEPSDTSGLDLNEDVSSYDYFMHSIPYPVLWTETVDLPCDDACPMKTCKGCGCAGELICCGACTSSYHLSCSGLFHVPSGTWFCPRCRG